MNQHAMMQTISEQPALIRRLYENRKEITKDFVAFFQTHDIKKIYLSGHGAAETEHSAAAAQRLPDVMAQCPQICSLGAAAAEQIVRLADLFQ